MTPPRTILAAVDFSDSSRTALVLAARFARHSGAALHVLHVENALLSASARQAGINLQRETDEELEAFITSAWPAAECAPQRHVVTGSAVEGVLDTARRLQARMVVVGSHGMSGAERLVFGSTTEGILRTAAVSVLVAPAGWTPPRPDTPDLTGVGPAIVGMDFSESSAAAAREACHLATLLGTSVTIVHVVEEMPVLARWRVHADAEVRDRVSAAQQRMDAVVDRLACTAPAQQTITTGAVPHCLLEAASTTDGRAILVLGRRASGARGGAPGAIAYRVLTLAKVPVLMHLADSPL